MSIFSPDIAKLERKHQKERIAKLLTNKSKAIQYRAAESLSRLGDFRGISFFMSEIEKKGKVLHNKNVPIDEEVAIMGKIGDAALLPLISFLSNYNELVRVASIDALSTISNPIAIGPIIEIIKSSNKLGVSCDPFIIAPAIKFFKKFGMNSFDQLLKYWDNSTICNIGVHVFGEYLNDPIHSNRVITVFISTLETVHSHKGFIRSGWSDGREIAMSIIKLFGDYKIGQAVDKLLLYLADKDINSDVQLGMIKALIRIGDKRGIDALENMLFNENTNDEITDSIQSDLISLGGEVGNRIRNIGPILVNLRSSSAKMRAQGAEKLAMLGDRRGLKDLINVKSKLNVDLNYYLTSPATTDFEVSMDADDYKGKEKLLSEIRDALIIVDKAIAKIESEK
ncbi:MAG: hypothetical protein JXA54_03345 [Candidatus Heimdallarchaeota archaeon]|nr:hypothetical protein [Candidatus Heimdallarchaeota archaeon]